MSLLAADVGRRHGPGQQRRRSPRSAGVLDGASGGLRPRCRAAAAHCGAALLCARAHLQQEG